MAISDKLNYLLDTKQLFKDRLNSLGAEITSATTFRNYLNWLDTFYEDVSDKTDIATNGVQGRTSQASSILPSEYTQVDYIQSSGTQYIDTGIKRNQDTKVNLDFEGTNFSYSGNKTIIGSRTSSTEKHYGITIAQGSNPYLYSGYNNTSQEGVRISLNTKYNIFKDKNITYLDNTQITNTTYTTFETPTNMYIFAMNEGSTKFYSSIKLFMLKIYNNNELVRDFIPCYRNSDNEVGLYDLVNDVFYTNQGTGTFTYGSVAILPNPSYPIPINNLTGNISYKVSGKNKFDKTNPNIINVYISATGQLVSNNQNTSVYISCKPNTTYTISRIQPSSGNNKFGVAYSSSLPTGSLQCDGFSRNNTADSITITTNENAKYLIVWCWVTDFTMPLNDTLASIQIESNPNATSFEPYIAPRTFTIPLGDIELCKIGTYKDKIYSSNGRFYLVKNINSTIINGTEPNFTADNKPSGLTYYSYNLYNDNFVMPSSVCYCDKLLYSESSLYSNDIQGIKPTSTGRIKIKVFDSSLSTVDLFKAWLSNNNLLMYYIMNTAIITEITEDNYPSLYNVLRQIQDYLTAYKINKEFILGYSSPEIEY